MASEVDRPVVERLDVDNYATWKTRMKFLLISKGLWSAISTEDADADTNMKALALIGLYVKEHHLPTLERFESAGAAWTHLEETYQAKSNARKLQLRKELTHLKMTTAEPLTKYVARAQDIRAQLRAAGHEVGDQELAWSVLAGLPTEYDTVVTVLETASDKDLTLEDILPKLLQVEQRRQQSNSSPGLALAATPGRGHYNHRPPHNHQGKQFSGRRPAGRGQPSSWGQQLGPCYYCGKNGHTIAGCETRLREQAARGQQRPQQQHRQQHRQQYSQRQQGQQSPNQSSHRQYSAIALTAHSASGNPSATSSGLPIGLSSSTGPAYSSMSAAATGSSTPEPTNWILDSGASRHITSNGNLLFNVRPPTTDITITFGNGGTGKAVAVGDVMLRTPSSVAPLVLTNVLHIPEATENLLSVRYATNRGLDFTFSSAGCSIRHNDTLVATAPCHGRSDIYSLQGECLTPAMGAFCATVMQPALLARAPKESPQLWHQRFGHLGYDNLAKLQSHNMVTGITTSADEFVLS